jgi:adenine deaminase
MLVAGGTDPATAVAMGTVNAALYYGVADRLGSIAPGKAADLVVVRDLEHFEPTDVLSAGAHIVRDGDFVGPTVDSTVPSYLRSRVRWPRPLQPRDFTIPARSHRAHVRVIGLVDGSLVSRALEATVPVVDGNARMEPDRDILKVAVIDRHSGRMAVGKGFVHGLGLKNGALATTCCYVHQNALVAGTSENQMARAANELAKIGGGAVVLSGEECIATWPLEIAGVLSALPLEEAQSSFQAVNVAMKQIGCLLSSPLQAVSFLALTTIPAYGLTDRGLYDVNRGSFVSTVFSGS